MRTILLLGLAMSVLPTISCANAEAQYWTAYKDPAGFSVTMPSGWTTAEKGKGYVVSSTNPRTFAFVAPFFARQQISSGDFLNALADLERDVFPNCKTDEVKQIKTKPDESVAHIRFGDGEEGIALCSIYHRSGMLYVIAAPADQFPSKRKTLAKVLSSFAFTGNSGAKEINASESPDLDFEPWTDPKEHAFKVEVPKGWTVDGGLFRYAPVDVRPTVVMQSPDHKIGVRIGDNTIMPRVLPNSMLQMGGYGQGSIYSPGYGVQMLVWPYQTGQEFAKEYAQLLEKKGYEDISVEKSEDRPDLAQPLTAVFNRYPFAGISLEFTAGDVAVTAKRAGEPFRGYYLAGTLDSVGQGNGMWGVQVLLGYMAAADRIEEAEAVLRHANATFKFDEQWSRMQSGIAQHTSEIVTETGHAISKIISETFWSKSKANEESFRKWDNYITDRVDVRDPETGETWKVEAGKNYYWRDANGPAAGTDTYDRPNTDMTPLEQY